MNDLFIGRKAEQEAFAKTLASLTSKKTILGLFKWSTPAPKQPRVYLISGSRGLGKSQLLRHFEQQCQAAAQVSWVQLDWNALREIGSLPDDLPAMLVEIHKAIGEQLGKQELLHFEAFAQIRDNRFKLQQKVEKQKAEDEKALATVAQGIGKLSGAGVGMVLPGTGELVSTGVEWGFKGVTSYLRKILSEVEYRLYTSPQDEYASAFVQGLVSLAESRPLILAQSRYEWIASNPKLEAQWRALVLRPVLQQTESFATVITSRTDLAEAYQQTFSNFLTVLYFADLQPFTAHEIQEAYQQSPEWSAQVFAQTGGHPPQVRDYVDYLQRTQQAPDMSNFAELGEQDQAGQKLFNRYLLETPHDAPAVARQKRSDRQKLYALALLRRYDVEAIARCWAALENHATQPLNPDDVFERLRNLRRDYEFLFTTDSEQLLPRYRQLILAQIDQVTKADAPERGVIRKINQSALDYYQQALAQRAAALPTLAERTNDAEWRSLSLQVFHHKLRLDPRAALPDFVSQLLEAVNSSHRWFDPFLQLANESDWQGQDWVATVQKVAQAIFAEKITDDDWATIQQLWDEIESRADKIKLAPLHRALLAHRRGLLHGRSGQFTKAADEFTKALELLPAETEPEVRADLLKALTGAAALLLFEKRDYEKAIAIARRTAPYAPQNLLPRQLEVLGLLGLKNYAEAQILLDELLDKNPDHVELLSARYQLHLAQGQQEEANRTLRQIMKIRPEFAHDTLGRILGLQQNDPQFLQALAAWQKDAGANPAYLDSFAKLRELPADVLTELFLAFFALSAKDKPTPEEILRVRELTVRHLPDWPNERLLLGLAYLNVGRLPDALAAFASARELAPKDPVMLVVPGFNLLLQGHPAAALPFLEDAIKAQPDQEGPHVLLVSCLINLERSAEAKARAEEALALYPDNALLSWYYGLILELVGEEEKSLRIKRRAFRADPATIEYDFKLLPYRPPAVLEKVKQGAQQYVGAFYGKEIGTTLTNLPPVEFARLWFQFIRFVLEVDDTEKLKPEILAAILSDLVTSNPKSIVLRLEVADCYENLGMRERAIAVLEEIADKVFSAAGNDIRRRLVKLYSANQDWKAVLRHLREVEEPLSADEYFFLAELYANEKRLKNALAVYDKALASAADEDAERVERFGIYQLSAGNFTRAEEFFRRKIALLPNDAMGLMNLAEALYSQQNYEAAKAAAEQAVKLLPESPWPAARLFRICKALGLTEDAARAEQAARQNLAQVEKYDRACILTMLGEENGALEQLEEAIRENPDFRAWAQLDHDFRELRNNVAFQKLVSNSEAASA